MSLACPHCGSVIEAEDLVPGGWITKFVRQYCETWPNFIWQDNWTMELHIGSYDEDIAKLAYLKVVAGKGITRPYPNPAAQFDYEYNREYGWAKEKERNNNDRYPDKKKSWDLY